MPNLPTFTVSDAAATRILKAFENVKDDAGVTMTPTAAYKAWLKQKLMERVTSSEAQANAATLSGELT